MKVQITFNIIFISIIGKDTIMSGILNKELLKDGISKYSTDIKFLNTNLMPPSNQHLLQQGANCYAADIDKLNMALINVGQSNLIQNMDCGPQEECQ